MPTVREVESFLFQWAPRDLACSWDNVGHLVGRREKKVERVLVALDITAEVVGEAVKGGYDLIISHHPLIFPGAGPLLSVRNDDLRGQILLELIRNDIAAICMHTNLDVVQGGVNDMLCERLNLEDVALLGDEDGVGRMGRLGEGMTLNAFLGFLRKRLRPNGMRYCVGSKNVHRVAVGGGACGDFFRLAVEKGCDTLVTSDVKYNQFMDAADLGLNLIDAGHYPTEDPVCYTIMDRLMEAFPELNVMKSYTHREVVQYYM